MNLTTVPGHSSTHFNITLPTFNRRRTLFPCEAADSESDSDLGHISPLNFDSSFEENNKVIPSKQSQKCDESIGDYDIIGVVENQNHVSSTPQGRHSQLEVMSPLFQSPYSEATPSKIPIFKLKTPHDALNTNSNLPKLLRKSLLDSEVSSVSNKRKISPDNSPDQIKQIKLDSKSSRVRTTLFPEVDFALSTKNFYPKSEDFKEKIINKRNTMPKSTVFSTNRKGRSSKKTGQINAGVRHKIRKPKPKKFNKTSVPKSLVSAAGNTAITEYIMDLKDLKSRKDVPKLITNQENIEPSQKLIKPAIIPEKKIEPVESKKRSLSPTTEPDQTKKFFKFSKTKNFEPKMDAIKDKSNNLDMTDLIMDESYLPKTNIDTILSCLEDDEDCIPKENKIILQATNSVVTSDNSILLHQPTCMADLILSPISQMCDVTSGLALNTPKKVRNLTPILEELTNENASDDQTQKMFPVFYPGHTGTPKNKDNVVTNLEKKFKKLPEDQMLIDAGQKEFGITQCFECNIVYHKGDTNDELMHFNYHNAKHILRYAGWKNERVVADFQNNQKILQILPRDPKIWWKKLKELLAVIKMDTGFYDTELSLDNCQVFLYINKKIITGCLVATPKSEGYQVLDENFCSEKSLPIKCGIVQIWVSPNHRKLGIGSQLVNALKRHFINGSVLYNKDIAFSCPTDMGKIFAEKYCKSKNYLVYFL